MNKIRIILIFCLLISCKTSRETIEITQGATEYSIILRLSKKYKKVIGIKFPQRISIKNNSIKKEAFIKINYEYNSILKERTYGILLFNEKKKSLTRISNNKKKEIPPYNSRKYIFYTRHFVDSISSIQNELFPYVNEMLKQNKDTLHIGTVTDFKKKHKELFIKLTKNDSLSIQFLDNGKLGERLIVPVEW